MMGRVVLIKLILSALPIYLMSNYVIPKAILLKLEGVIRNFLWGSMDSSRRIHILS